MSGEVVRIEELPDTRTLYGCRIVETSLNIGNYIAHKQKKEAKRRRLKRGAGRIKKIKPNVSAK
ncbi:MAG: hypothetical protein ACLR6H_03280 [Roseburia sp.]